MTSNSDEGLCICGRVHAPWWGKYVPAPTCQVNIESFRTALFRRLWIEDLEERAGIPFPDRGGLL